MKLKRRRAFLDDLAKAHNDMKWLSRARYYEAIGDIRDKHNVFCGYWLSRLRKGKGSRTINDQ